MKKLIFILLALSVISCQKGIDPEILVGDWESAMYDHPFYDSVQMNIYKGKENFLVGFSYKIKNHPDSTPLETVRFFKWDEKQWALVEKDGEKAILNLNDRKDLIFGMGARFTRAKGKIWNPR